MRLVAAFSVTLILFLVLCSCDSPESPVVNQYTLDQFMSGTSLLGNSFSHDETRVLFSTDKSGVYNAWAVSVNGGEPEQITHSDSNGVFTIGFLPDGSGALLQSAPMGSNLYHIYVREEDGSMRDLTPFEGGRTSFIGWNHSRDKIYFHSNKRDQQYMDVYAMDVDTFGIHNMFTNEAGLEFAAVSRDDRYIALSGRSTGSLTNDEMLLFDMVAGELKRLSPEECDFNIYPQAFDVDSRSLYYLTDEDSEFMYLKRYDIESGDSETVEKLDMSITLVYFSYNGTYRVLALDNNARTEIRVTNAVTGEALELPGMPEGDITSLIMSDSERYMAFYVSNSLSPASLYLYDIEAGSCRKLMDGLNPEIDVNDLVEAEIVSYPSFDGLEIPALMYKPRHADSGATVPAIVNVHTGPGGQARIGYSGLIQFLLNRGYAVIDVNYRGSVGYGESFLKADDKKHGEYDLADCVAAKKFLTSTGYVDTSRVAIMGSDYGGYIALAAMTFRPDEFAAGVDLFGISNWLRVLNSIPAQMGDFRKAIYDEMGDPTISVDHIRRISPIYHADSISRPLMIVQGAQDQQVLRTESDEIVDIAESNGVPVEYLVFENEGRSLTSKENYLKAYEAVLEFLDEHLK